MSSFLINAGLFQLVLNVLDRNAAERGLISQGEIAAELRSSAVHSCQHVGTKNGIAGMRALQKAEMVSVGGMPSPSAEKRLEGSSDAIVGASEAGHLLADWADREMDIIVGRSKGARKKTLP